YYFHPLLACSVWAMPMHASFLPRSSWRVAFCIAVKLALTYSGRKCNNLLASTPANSKYDCSRFTYIRAAKSKERPLKRKFNFSLTIFSLEQARAVVVLETINQKSQRTKQQAPLL